MATIKTKLLVGVFVIVGFSIATISIIWLGMANYFEKGLYYVAYFDESVQGLDKDSPVKYRGVPIGRVENIKVAPDATLIEVTMKIEEGLKPEEHREDVVAQLKSVGITGIMFVEIERKKENAPDLSPRINFSPRYPVIATRPSEIKKLFKGIDDIVHQINSLDLAGISSKINSTLNLLNRGVEDMQLKALSSDLRKSLAVVRSALDSVEQTSLSVDDAAAGAGNAVSSLNRILVDNEKALAEAISGFNASMQSADRLLTDGSELIDKGSDTFNSIQFQLTASLNNLEAATRRLNELIGRLGDNPSLLIFGAPAPARSVEKP